MWEPFSKGDFTPVHDVNGAITLYANSPCKQVQTYGLGSHWKSISILEDMGDREF